MKSHTNFKKFPTIPKADYASSTKFAANDSSYQLWEFSTNPMADHIGFNKFTINPKEITLTQTGNM